MLHLSILRHLLLHISPECYRPITMTSEKVENNDVKPYEPAFCIHWLFQTLEENAQLTIFHVHVQLY